jgi:DNA polymerase-1
MVTPDKDYGQLVTEKIKIYKPPYQGGTAEILGPAEVCGKWGIERVDQVVDMLGLMGDAVDNIPGIKGIGEKTAAKLLAQYGTLEEILTHAEDIKGAVGEKVKAGKEMAILSKKLATILTRVPVQFHEEDFKISEMNRDLLRQVFTDLEFKTMGRRILGEELDIAGASPYSAPVHARENKNSPQLDLFGASPDPETAVSVADGPVDASDEPMPGEAVANIHHSAHRYELVAGEKEIGELITRLQSQQEICFDTETTSLDANDAELVGMSFSYKGGEACYVPFPSDQSEAAALLKKFSPLFADESKCWIGHNIKYDLLVLKWYGVEVSGKRFDTMLAHYAIEPEGKSGMDALSLKYLRYEPVHIEELIGKKGKGQGNMRDVDLEKIKDYAAEDADITFRLRQALLPLLRENEAEHVFFDIENPLVNVLTDMEFEGIRIDTEFLASYSRILETEARAFEEQVYAQAGTRFNLASPRQLGEVLFEKMQLDPKAKKTKTGQYATGEDVLAKLAVQHKICNDILSFRELTKLKNTYVDALPQLVNRKTGRVHTSFAQAIAVTGRLSSNNPNLQNIPVRTERGREIRKAFIPRNPDFVLVSADYSQIELRIVAAISGDANMCAAFREGKDIHTATAARVFNVPEAEVTREMRYKAKSVNFGIIYGQGAFGLSENLGIPRAEAKTIIDNYKKEFPGIQQYMDDSIRMAREKGYVQTLSGRRRRLKDINSANFTVRGFAERNAINSPIQGTAADMIKLAMIRIHHLFSQHNFKSRMILQVHDELVFDAHRDELDLIRPLILESMKAAMPLPGQVPVEAEIGSGNNWLEAH